jgi:hypothetical protein
VSVVRSSGYQECKLPSNVHDLLKIFSINALALERSYKYSVTFVI